MQLDINSKLNSLIRYLVTLLLAISVVLLSLASFVKADLSDLDDLLDPQLSYENDKRDENLPLFLEPQKGINVDELLGPKDTFPFLPDNHRDSGTGKFNGF